MPAENSGFIKRNLKNINQKSELLGRTKLKLKAFAKALKFHSFDLWTCPNADSENGISMPVSWIQRRFEIFYVDWAANLFRQFLKPAIFLPISEIIREKTTVWKHLRLFLVKLALLIWLFVCFLDGCFLTNIQTSCFN